MALRTLTIWPNVAQAELLQAALVDAQLCTQPLLLDGYPQAGELEELLRSIDPPVDAIIVGFDDVARASEIVRALRAQQPDLTLLAADRNESSESLLAALRSGVDDYVRSPFEATELSAALQKSAALAASKPAPKKRGTVYCFFPCQGTDGASTIAIHVAHGLAAEAQSKTALIECDLQCGTTAFRLGLTPEYTLGDALEHAELANELWGRLPTRWRDVDILPAPGCYNRQVHENSSRLPAVLRSAIGIYDYVIVDLPPSLDEAGRAAVQAADQVFVVCTPEVASLHLARRKAAHLQELGVSSENVRLIVNRVGSRHSLNPQEVRKAVGAPIYSSLNNDYDAVSEAALRGGLIATGTKLGNQLRTLALRLAGREEKAPEENAWKRLLSFR